MKILLLGDFSSLHKVLRDGLLELGNNTILASDGDSWKSIDRDIDLGSNLPYPFGNIIRKFKPYTNIKKFSGFDVVQLINPFFFDPRFFLVDYYYKYIMRNNKSLFMLAAGSDAYYWRYGKKYLRYGPFNDYLKYDAKRSSIYLQSKKAFSFNKKIASICNLVIPVMYDYQICYKSLKNVNDPIPIPINVKEIKYFENIVKERIRVFHGLNRYGFKGTKYVEEAFHYLSNKYPNDFEFSIMGKMPIDSYMKLLRRTNIIIDQTSSYSLGVNGLLAMAMGKVVLGGAERESLKHLDIKKSPVFNIVPSAKSIINTLEYLRANKELISKIGFDSRQYVESHHDHIKIAEKYIKVWSNK